MGEESIDNSSEIEEEKKHAIIDKYFPIAFGFMALMFLFNYLIWVYSTWPIPEFIYPFYHDVFINHFVIFRITALIIASIFFNYASFKAHGFKVISQIGFLFTLIKLKHFKLFLFVFILIFIHFISLQIF